MSDPVSHVQKTANNITGNKNSDDSESGQQLQSLSITNANCLKTTTEFTELLQMTLKNIHLLRLSLRLFFRICHGDFVDLVNHTNIWKSITDTIK
jgi:hypothetical protein